MCNNNIDVCGIAFHSRRQAVIAVFQHKLVVSCALTNAANGVLRMLACIQILLSAAIKMRLVGNDNIGNRHCAHNAGKLDSASHFVRIILGVQERRKINAARKGTIQAIGKINEKAVQFVAIVAARYVWCKRIFKITT